MTTPVNETPVGLIEGGPLLEVYSAIKARLREAFPPARFTHQVIPPQMSPDLWRKLTDAMPMIGFGWTSWHPGQSQRRAYSGNAEFVLFLCTRNARQDWLLTGDKTAPGVLAMSAIAAAYLQGWTISGIGTCAVRQLAGAVTEGWVNDEIAVVAMSIVVPDVSLTDPVMQAQLSDFLELGVAWEFGGDEDDQTINVRGDA